MTKKIIIIILAIFAAMIISAAFLFFWYQRELNFSMPNQEKNYKIIEIEEGESAKSIAQKLKNKKVIRNDNIFWLYARIKKGTLKAGFYNLSAKMTVKEIYERIASGKTNIVKVTFPEGFRAEQIAQVLENKNLVSYDEFLQKAKKFEGKLFPDTFYFYEGITADEIVGMMLEDYMGRTKSLNPSDEDLIIASIVEREAVTDEERPLIAGIYKNRVSGKMKLEADPTVQYGKDDLELVLIPKERHSDFEFWQKITLADYLTVDSPFNTYIIESLPPKPICNPGIKSIEATKNYQKHNYLYFLHKDGQIYPSETLEEHDQKRSSVLGAKTKR